MPSTWIQIVGAKKTGKTSLIEGITRELVGRGRSVCYVKHTHSEPGFDNEDTDTARIRNAGASTSVLAGTGSTIAFHSGATEALDRISFRDALSDEIVLAEGFKQVPGKKIVMPGGDLEIDKLEGIVALVGDAPDGYKGTTFDQGDIAGICDLIEKLAASGGGEMWSTRLFIDGEEIKLNSFVQDVMASAVLGMSTALKGIEGGGEIELRCAVIADEE
jgi:molybdopterin-guanine dinucleotide biosynthesis protein B